MNPWKLIIEQVESGYAVYRVFMIWQHTSPPPETTKLEESKFGKGVWLPDARSISGLEERFSNPTEAYEAAKKWQKKWFKDNKW
jgi:hypothetical protein